VLGFSLAVVQDVFSDAIFAFDGRVQMGNGLVGTGGANGAIEGSCRGVVLEVAAAWAGVAIAAAGGAGGCPRAGFA
jgi:hypothetical protein